MSSRNSPYVIASSSEVTLYSGVLKRAVSGKFALSFSPVPGRVRGVGALGRLHLSVLENNSYSPVLSLTGVSYKKFESIGEGLDLERVEDYVFKGEL